MALARPRAASGLQADDRKEESYALPRDNTPRDAFGLTIALLCGRRRHTSLLSTRCHAEGRGFESLHPLHNARWKQRVSLSTLRSPGRSGGFGLGLARFGLLTGRTFKLAQRPLYRDP